MNENVLLMVQDFCSNSEPAIEHVSILYVLGLISQQIKRKQLNFAKEKSLGTTNKYLNIWTSVFL